MNVNSRCVCGEDYSVESVCVCVWYLTVCHHLFMKASFWVLRSQDHFLKFKYYSLLVSLQSIYSTVA